MLKSELNKEMALIVGDSLKIPAVVVDYLVSCVGMQFDEDMERAALKLVADDAWLDVAHAVVEERCMELGALNVNYVVMVEALDFFHSIDAEKIVKLYEDDVHELDSFIQLVDDSFICEIYSCADADGDAARFMHEELGWWPEVAEIPDFIKNAIDWNDVYSNVRYDISYFTSGSFKYYFNN